MLWVGQIRAEGARAGPVLLVLEELLRRRVAEEEAVGSAEEATRAYAPCWIGRLRATRGGVGQRWYETSSSGRDKVRRLPKSACALV